MSWFGYDRVKSTEPNPHECCIERCRFCGKCRDCLDCWCIDPEPEEDEG